MSAWGRVLRVNGADYARDSQAAISRRCSQKSVASRIPERFFDDQFASETVWVGFLTERLIQKHSQTYHLNT